ncbi:MAG: D-tyrosyl-tRNA(Tyr) deacylase [Deltaproteobacteria bacterium]|nr:D-tyrosyl-tRNA(Tyr) deacylase [Deltaproteobacteria bacterium]
MRAVVQRVSEACVEVEGEEVGRVGAGLLVYLGVGQGDTDKDLDYLSAKVAGLRIFPDEKHSMNHSVLDAGGAALVISQLTLHGDARRGKRPSFDKAMEPQAAEQMYERFVERLEALGVPCASGVFGAMMDVKSVNDGPVTILVDSHKTF